MNANDPKAYVAVQHLQGARFENVGELIKALKQFPPDTQVFVWENANGLCVPKLRISDEVGPEMPMFIEFAP